ncbi:MAG: hypothetical protein KAT68_11050 [Bacteroidales bacterium]|nr:hypothetical protein [Bacteroidales bacterium]
MLSNNHISFKISIVLLLTILFSCQQEKELKKYYEISCNVEKQNDTNDKILSNDSRFTFSNSYLRTEEEANSGNYSVKIYDKHAFGLSIVFNDVIPGEYFNISVWRLSQNNNGALVASDNTAKLFYRQKNLSEKTNEKGWELITLDFTIPLTIEDGILKIYVWNPDSIPAYFDDIKIQRQKEKIYPSYDIEALKIIINETDFQKLSNKCKEALINKILETEKGDWVKCIVIHGNEKMKAQIRLKGDKLDHLEDDKWSFRIKLKKGSSWNGMRTFSIQNPKTRDFLSEWIAHKIFDEADVISTRYGFVPVILNDKSLGIYAYEEHFEKHLIENKNRREGPILKFKEDVFWKLVKYIKETLDAKKLPLFESSEILPFKFNTTFNDTVLYKEFIIGQNLMYQHKWFLKPSSYSFDIDKLAKYYALIDITKTYHGLTWFNRRFYYNPVLCKLEPIAFDGYLEDGVYDCVKSPIYGNFSITNYAYPNLDMLSIYHFFSNDEFLNKYVFYLNKFSDEKYIEKIIKKYNSDIKYYESLIKKEFKYYKYDYSFLKNNASDIKNALPDYINKIKKESDYAHIIDSNISIKGAYDTITDKTFPPYFVKAYCENTKEKISEINVFNFYSLDIKLLGTGSKNKDIEHYFKDKPTLNSYNKNNNNSIIVKSNPFAKFLFFSIEENDTVYNIPIFSWQSPKNYTPQQELVEKYSYKENDSVKLYNNTIIFKSRNYSFSQPLIIPSGYIVKFEQGTIIDFTNNALFISYSPVIMKGTKSKPIIIKSSDGTCNGFTVLQANKKSYVKDVIFDNLNTLNYKGWSLTGAVNFYESNVNIIYTSFSNNNCEDALNIIRSDFSLKFSTFDNIFADAFDSDFCNGYVYKTIFTNIKNDAIDFSGSQITIEDCEVINSEDKAISCGEKSNLIVNNIVIKNSNIAFASKDLSNLIINNAEITDCKYGFVAFKKKPEFGSAKIEIKLLKHNKVKQLYLIEKKSTLTIDGKIIKGTEKDMAKLFYP